MPRRSGGHLLRRPPADLAAGVEDFRTAGAEEFHLSSNDGTLGIRGFVTDLLASHPAPRISSAAVPNRCCTRVATQAGGPRHPVPRLAGNTDGVRVGICFSLRDDGENARGDDYKRVCVDGPIFDAAKLCW